MDSGSQSKIFQETCAFGSQSLSLRSHIAVISIGKCRIIKPRSKWSDSVPLHSGVGTDPWTGSGVPFSISLRIVPRLGGAPGVGLEDSRVGFATCSIVEEIESPVDVTDARKSPISDLPGGD